ncbi:MAG: ATP-dependent zinc metalloprotease FtsH [Rikenellaceae bacterium]|nr:ATP-dependent zinc metalloprotease FtsH [Rikenellaceae bacterium]
MAKKPNRKNRQQFQRTASFMGMFWGGLLIFIIGWGMLSGDKGEPVETDWSVVEQMVANGEVAQINIVNKEKAEVELTEKAIEKYREQPEYKNIPKSGHVQLYFTIGSVDAFREDMAVAEQGAEQSVVVKYEKREDRWLNIIANLLPWILLIGFWVFMMRSARGGGGGNVMNVGKARAQVYDKDNTENRVTFKDVAGMEEAKQEIMEIVDFLRRPQKYRELGGKIPKGALLVGPPGTGKTMLAKAVAGEANVPFLSISGSDFVEMFVGVGASRVRDLFQQAKEKAPCIVFIDEIDAIGRARGKNAGFSGNDERENTLNQMLTEMDGFATNSGVIVLAATNRADILDKALMRAGRFDRQIDVGLPDVKEREAIFGVHTRKLRCAPDISHEFLAKQTAGFSGADIANVCNEAALIAARHDKKLITKEDFLAAIDRIVGGLEKKNTVMTAKERYATAVHEAGHAAVMWLLPECDPVVKVTIIPRGKSLGATWYLPEERTHITSGNLRQRMSGMVAGRVAEQTFLGTIGTGALNDLERTSNMAYAMVAYYGMSEKIGNVSYYDSTGQRDAFTKPFSEQTAREIDEEVRRLIDEATDEARTLIEANREKVEQLANLLVERETVFAEDIEKIFGRSAHDERKEAETPATEQTDTTEPSEGAPVATDEPQSEVAEANVAEANVAEAATAEATPTNEQKAE